MTNKTRYFMATSGAVVVAGLMTGLVAYRGGGVQPLFASSLQTELAFVPSDAAVVAYADVRAIMDSELRQRLKLSIPVPADGQAEFQAQTGIDIERDIDYVVAAMVPGTTGTMGDKSGLIVARGRFDVVKLEGLAREHGATVEEYGGKRLVSIVGNGNAPAPDGTQTLRAGHPSMTIAFLEPGVVAFGESATVKHAIDAQARAQSLSSNNEITELVNDIERSNNAWAVGRLDVLTSHAQLPAPVAAQLGSVKWFAAAAHVDGGLSGTIRAEARDDQSAENLRDVVRGVLALGRLQAQSDVRLAAAAESLQLAGTGKTVSLSFTVPVELIDMAVAHAQTMAPKVLQH
ncbi:MAG: hypothetical protein ABIX28_06750 [Vicinamibacterales bacterium]